MKNNRVFSPQLLFVIFYIAEFAKVINSTHDVSFNVLTEHGVLDYLEKHYEVLHTQGRLYVLTDIVEMLIDSGYFPKDSSTADIVPEYRNMRVKEI
ncbi:MAG: DUF3791 domain-containing protein [Oscillospiraceae bacterium]|nr:DUF3791 domain-containing protein [Oscillospiraceae bacterium]